MGVALRAPVVVVRVTRVYRSAVGDTLRASVVLTTLYKDVLPMYIYVRRVVTDPRGTQVHNRNL